MSVKVDGSRAKVHWLSNDHTKGCLTKNQGILYITRDNKLGKATAESYAGLTPAEAFERRYNGMKSAMTADFVADDLIVFDKELTEDADPDDGVRSFILSLSKKKRIPFSANVGTVQKENTNSEALLSYAREEHLDILLDTVKQYFGLTLTFDTKDPVIWRFKQEDDIAEIFERLIEYRLCLYAAYTSRGKTKIGIETAVRLCQEGGIVLVTTPITDTKKSFEENINDFHFGADRNLKVTYMDSIEFSRFNVRELRHRANNGELIFVVLTVQDLRYGENDTVGVDASTKKLRDKYHALSGEVNLWIRDERHAQYGGEVTSQRLADMLAEYELDLTATPYNVMEQYDWKQIVTRTLLWGLQYKNQTRLPTIRIDAISTPLSAVSSKIANIYSEEEGFDPRKLFIRDNQQFVLEAELKEIRDRLYHSTASKKKNPLSIVNDTKLSPVAKNCGLWVLPEGQDGDGAGDYIPALANMLSTNSKTYFTDSYTIERECPKNMTIGSYIESIVNQFGRVVILTCGKFLTGTDIPVLGHIVLMSKMNNVANFEQLLGRMIREYPSKDEVKLYAFAPAMEIGLVQGKMAKMSVALAGGSEFEMLECIPLTEYDVSGSPNPISPGEILEEVQEFFKRVSKDKLPSAQLESALSGVDLSVWEKLDTKKFKKSGPKAGLTDENGSKVKQKLGVNPKTGKPRTKDELTKINQIVNAFQSVMVEAKWVAYSIDNYDYNAVLNNDALVKMFPEETKAILDTIEDEELIKDMVVKNLKEKQLAYKGLSPEDVYDDIFMNNSYKQGIGLVYVPFSMAKEIVDKIPKNKYNKEGKSILVFNALSGTIPLMLKEKFPKARIVCAEYFDYFAGHLTRLGFEVAKVYSANGVVKLEENHNMKFDVILGNPPYQSEKGTGTQPLWPLFVNKAFDLLSNDGQLAMITPNKWCGHTANVIKGGIRLYSDLFKGKLVECNIQECSKYFPKVGGYENCFSYFVVDNAGSNSFVATTLDDTFTVDKDQFDFLPLKLLSDTTASILKKVVTSDSYDFKQVSTGFTNKNDGSVVISMAQRMHYERLNVYLDKDTTFSATSKSTVSNKKFDKSSQKKVDAVFRSSLFKFIHKIYWNNDNFGTSFYNSLPYLDLNNLWTDEKIYKHFDLKQEEIDYIEANVK